DKIGITESTFNELDVGALQQGNVKAGEVRTGYRATIGEDEVSEFADIVSSPLDQRSYVCRALIEPDSRALRSLGKVIAGHDDEIKSLADAAAEATGDFIATLHPAAALAAPLVQLLGKLSAIISAQLISALARKLQPRSLPAWLISHTVV